MTTQKTLKRLQTLIWILIYGGLLTLVLGLATQAQDEDLGQCMAIAGGVVAALGFALIVVRSRLRLTEPS